MKSLLPSFSVLHSFFFFTIIFLGFKTPLLAEGSKDFVDYPGHRMHLDCLKPNQLKVYANEGETINVGASHVGMAGGYIMVCNPVGDTIIVFDNTGVTANLAIINDHTEEMAGPTGGGTTNGSGYVPGTVTVPAGQTGIWTIIIDFPFYNTARVIHTIFNNDPWSRDTHQLDAIEKAVVAWDITVTSGGAGNLGGTPIEGRVYSNEHTSLLDGNSSFPFKIRSASQHFMC